VRRDGEQFSRRLQIPDVDLDRPGRLTAGRGQPLPVVAERYADPDPRVFLERVDHRAAAHVPDLHFSRRRINSTGRRESAAVGAEHHTPNLARMALEGVKQAEIAGVPDFDGSVSARGSQVLPVRTVSGTPDLLGMSFDRVQILMAQPVEVIP